MKFYCSNCILKFEWNQVTSALWRRYPNPYSLHVLSEDVISRTLQDNKLITKKLITKTNRMPRWGERFVSSKVACVVEESITDPETGTFTTYTRNITYTKLMVVEEKCIYSVHPANKEWTICEKQSWITSGVFGFARAIERFGVERYKKNASKASKGLQFVLEKLFIPERPPMPLALPMPHSTMLS